MVAKQTHVKMEGRVLKTALVTVAPVCQDFMDLIVKKVNMKSQDQLYKRPSNYIPFKTSKLILSYTLITLDNCASNPCQNGGTCTSEDFWQNMFGYTCTCMPGFSGTNCDISYYRKSAQNAFTFWQFHLNLYIIDFRNWSRSQYNSSFIFQDFKTNLIIHPNNFSRVHSISMSKRRDLYQARTGQ